MRPVAGIRPTRQVNLELNLNLPRASAKRAVHETARSVIHLFVFAAVHSQNLAGIRELVRDIIAHISGLMPLAHTAKRDAGET